MFKKSSLYKKAKFLIKSIDYLKKVLYLCNEINYTLKTNKMKKSKKNQLLSNQVHLVLMTFIIIILITINV
jgi:hypothetical protein